MGGFGEDTAERIAKKRTTPEFEAGSWGCVAADVASFMSHSIDHRYVYTVGDGMGTLNGAPGVVLDGTDLGFFRRMPADCGGIEENLRALQSGEAGALGIPLIPADQRAHSPDVCIKGAKAEIARSKVIFFVVKRIIRDVHFAVQTANRAVGVKDDRRVVIHARGALLEKGGDKHDAKLFCQRRKRIGRRAGNGFGQIEQSWVFTLAEVLSLEKFRQTDDLGAARGRLTNLFDGALLILFGIGVADIWISPTRNFSGGKAKTSSCWCDGIGYQFSVRGSQFSVIVAMGCGI